MTQAPHGPVGPRVRVTGPRTGRPRHTTVAAEIDQHSDLGEVYMRSLIRIQLRLGLAIAGVLLCSVGALPLAFKIWPGVRRLHLLGVPLPWLLLGFVVYPVLVGLGWIYVRLAERNESDFLDLVER